MKKICHLYIIPTVIWLVVCFLSFFPVPENAVSHWSFRVDLLVHFLMYFCFVASLLYGQKKYIGEVWLYIGSIVFAIFLGAVIEVLQEKYFYPRTCDILDFIFDFFGCIFAFVIIIKK